jgi:radical SAM superfamily enzyme YgiQ (UPF0313 family)
MKVLFTNAPFVKSEKSAAENNFAVDGFVCPKCLATMRGSYSILKFFKKYFGLSNGVKYGIRAGSRWPLTTDFPVCNSTSYPFFMGYAAANLKAHGIDVNIIDAIVAGEHNYKSYLQQVISENADIIVFEISTPTIDIDLWLANQIAEFTDVALVGPHVSAKTADLIKQTPKVKYYLKGEYVLNCLKMVKTQQAGIYDFDIIKDLDAFPFPFRDYYRAGKYFDPSMPTPKPQLQMYASKGCPFKCSFCYWPQNMYKGQYSPRSPQLIYEEIVQAIELHDYKSIFFDDDTFNLGTERISQLCDLLKKLNLPWTMMGRLDCSPNWLFDKMCDSGCVGMRFGIETFDLECLKKIDKGIEKVDFLNTIKHLSRRYPELMIHLTMMKDMPGQTEKIHNNDMKILKDLGYSTNNVKRSYQLSRCVPFPGTRMYDELVKQHGNKKLDSFKDYDGAVDTIMKELK